MKVIQGDWGRGEGRARCQRVNRDIYFNNVSSLATHLLLCSQNPLGKWKCERVIGDQISTERKWRVGMRLFLYPNSEWQEGTVGLQDGMSVCDRKAKRD